LPNVKAYVLDKHRQPVPIGVVGELYIGGAGVARGYINEPEMTKQKLYRIRSIQARQVICTAPVIW